MRGRGHLLEAFLLGGTSEVPRDIEQAFRESGLSHVVAISGLQVVLVAALVRWVTRLAGLGFRACDLAALASTLLYALLAAPVPSAQRAAIGTSVFLLVRLAGRRLDPASGLSIVALLLLIPRPGLVHDAGFHLSFAATAGLMAIPSRFLPMGGVRRVLFGLLAAGVAAQAATVPIVAAHFGRVSVYALGANLVAVPLGTVIVALGGTVALAGAVWSPLTAPLIPVVDGLLYALVVTCEVAPKQPPLALRTLPVGAAGIALYYALLAGARWAPSERARCGLIAAFLLGGAWIVAGKPLYGPVRDGKMHLDLIDVGQGDALLLRTPSGGTLLVDGGPAVWDPAGKGGKGRSVRFDAGGSIVGPALRRLSLSKLDAVMVTHSHSDHAGGMETVIKEFRPARLYVAPLEDDPGMRRLAALAGRWGVRTKELRKGDRLDLGDGVEAAVLMPDREALAREDPNARSLVVSLRYRRCALLLTGDLDEEGQKRMTAPSAPVACDLLKVPHHGSDRSLDESLVAAAGPPVAFISVGLANPWGHPGPAALRRLGDAGIRVFRSDVDGALRASSNGFLLEAGPVAAWGPLVVRAASSRAAQGARE
jgi:competence protein ComEC